MIGLRNILLREIHGSSIQPIELVLEVTDACNSRCRHCSIWNKDPVKNILSAEEIELALTDKLFWNLKTILVTGGEPILRHDLDEVVLAMNRARPRAEIFLSTNGLLPERTMNIVEKITTNAELKLGIGVSLDGIGERHDTIRGVKGNFEKVDDLLHRLVAYRKETNIGLAIGFVLSDLTRENLKEVKSYANKMNIDVVVQWLDENVYYGNTGLDLNQRKLMEEVKSLPDTVHREYWLRYLKGKSIRFPCFAMCSFFLLRCNGDVTPCLRYADLRAGNIQEMSPSEIWRSRKAKEARRTVKSCTGCLNNWGTWLSFQSAYFPLLFFKLKKKLVR
jgi:MoaA/NifB/PqqE/SkfB family radical SAM enzyme